MRGFISGKVTGADEIITVRLKKAYNKEAKLLISKVVVDGRGFEPPTSTLRTWRSPN
jgi:hypothetical protein